MGNHTAHLGHIYNNCANIHDRKPKPTRCGQRFISFYNTTSITITTLNTIQQNTQHGNKLERFYWLCQFFLDSKQSKLNILKSFSMHSSQLTPMFKYQELVIKIVHIIPCSTSVGPGNKAPMP